MVRDGDMKKILTGAAALLATTTIASAGGLDRSGQPVTALFEKGGAMGGYAELSYRLVQPDQQGSVAGGAVKSGDMASDYVAWGGAIKADMGTNLSFAVIFDQPFGADVDYTDADANYPLKGTTAQVKSNAITALVRYRMDNGFSVHGGLRHVTAEATLRQFVPGKPAYVLDADSASGTGYVIGAAYEKPEIAMRAAITYSSAIEMEHDTTLGGVLPVAKGVKYDLPKSVNIDLQTGVAPGTLVFASARWTDWKNNTIKGPLPGKPAVLPLVTHDKSVWEYQIGVGRQFTDKLSGFAAIGWEPGTGGKGVSNLSPSNGTRSLSLGGSYQVTDAFKLSGGVSWQTRGDATTEAIGAKFDDNKLFGVGIRASYTF